MSLLLAVVLVWGAISGVREIGGTIYNAINWQAAENAKLETVRPDMPISKLQETFGEADHVQKMNPSDEGDQMIWKERGYFLVVHEVDQIVTSYAVHACNSSIRPSVGIGAGRVVANQTKLDGPEHTQWPPRRAYYNWAPSFIEMYEGRLGGRAEAFQEVFWGLGVACQWEATEDMPLLGCTTKHDKVNCTKNVDQPIKPDDIPAINQFRSQLTVQVVGAQRSMSSGFAPREELIMAASVFEQLGPPKQSRPTSP
ncbi:hypothetical protein [Micropruina sonneratiae]|uniref:hypothetical protein n=1 Tax=Micropruina sonneratiae TaxID=2986940 RepID=UPI002227DB65|nr:hypothetical protein [Micropruina sp. KQZ13P-5]MCW3159594.1 hypothetical protein [Micropruina sp. KQZ13P-5]